MTKSQELTTEKSRRSDDEPDREGIPAGQKVIEGTFTIISPVLDPDEEEEWLITIGDVVIPVVVVDQDFLQAVKEDKISFASGCSIVGELEVTQWLTGKGSGPTTGSVM